MGRRVALDMLASLASSAIHRPHSRWPFAVKSIASATCTTWSDFVAFLSALPACSFHTQRPISHQGFLKSITASPTSQATSPRPQLRCGLKHGISALHWLKRQTRYAGKFTVQSAIILTRRPAFRDRRRKKLPFREFHIIDHSQKGTVVFIFFDELEN